MEIKTKFNRGERIFLIISNQVKNPEIDEIKIRITENTEQISY